MHTATATRTCTRRREHPIVSEEASLQTRTVERQNATHLYYVQAEARVVGSVGESEHEAEEHADHRYGEGEHVATAQGPRPVDP